MKKILILAYDFPPYVSVGGLRPKSWFDHLKEFGVEPIVITRQWSNQHGNHLDYVERGESDHVLVEKFENGSIIRTPYRPNLSNRLLLKYGESKFKLFRKVLTAYYEIFQFLLPIGTKIGLYKAADDYLAQNNVNAIIATGDPFVLFHYAKKLSAKHNLPWLADYRDPWSNDFENHGSWFQKSWSRLLEKKTVKTANAITTVSDILQIKITDVTQQKNISVIPNGFDTNAIQNVCEIAQNNDFLTIGFAGSIFLWNPIDHFLETINDFNNSYPNRKIRIHFFGVNIAEKLKNKLLVKFPELQNQIEIFPRIPNQEVLEKLAVCNVLLVFNHYSILGTKIFDYIGLRRKILLCFTNDKHSQTLKTLYFPMKEIDSQSNSLQEELIQSTHSGIAVKDSEHLKIVLKELTDEFKATGQIACHSVNVEKYSRKIQVEKLANVIHSIC